MFFNFSNVLKAVGIRSLLCNNKDPSSIPALSRFEHLCDLLYHQTLSNGGVVGAVGIRSLPSNHKVQGSIPCSAQI